VLREIATTTVATGGRVPSAERLAAIEAKIRDTVSHGRAANTLRAYAGDWADFVTWCDAVGLQPLPATPGTVAGYLSEMKAPPDDRPPLKVATMTRRLAALGQVHQVCGYPNPCVDQLVKDFMRGARRDLGVAPRQKKAIATDDIRAAVTALDNKAAADRAKGAAGSAPQLLDVRDRLLLLLGFAGAMRRSELASIDLADVDQVPEGLLVHLRHSKTDQDRKGRKVEIVYGNDEATCPVRAYRAWVTRLERQGVTDGPLFRRVDHHGRLLGPLSAEAVAIVVKRHMGRLGYTASDFAGHSLRRGMATTAARNGASERTIMRTTGHTSAATVRGYIEDSELFTDPASGYLGL